MQLNSKRENMVFNKTNEKKSFKTVHGMAAESTCSNDKDKISELKEFRQINQ